MRERWQAQLDKVDSLSLRERALVLLSALTLSYLLWDVVIYSPLAEAKAVVQGQIAASEQRIDVMRQEEAVLQQTLKADPDQQLKRELKELDGRMAVLDASLSELSVGLVPANKLSTILREVLGQTGSLQLHKLQTLPVEELKLSVKSGSDATSAGVYKHVVAITLNGSYFQVLNYLKTLEDMNWRFYWDELRYERDRYPSGLFEIRVYTLSTDEGLFGV